MEKNLILDVGCGNNPQGNINLDRYINEETLHVNSMNLVLVDPKKIPNPVKADAHFLPFRNGSFEKVLCRHALEHLRNPAKALKEMVRVSNSVISLILPHRYSLNHRKAWKKGTHKSSWNLTYTRGFLNQLGFKEGPHCDSFQINLKYRCLPNLPFLGICLVKLPWEIEVMIKKGG